MNFARLDTTPDGLTTLQAYERLGRYGANAIEQKQTYKLARKLARRLSDPLVLILVAAALLSRWAGDLASFWLIGCIVAISIVLDIAQEHRAETAAEALKRSVAIRADVLRDGDVVSLPVEEVVPGDIVEVRAGDLVPADGVVLSARNLYANQAMLTGEPYPVEKVPQPGASYDVAEAVNALFMGSSILSGSGRMLVVATGSATRFGAIAVGILADVPPTKFEREMHRYGAFILRLTMFLVLFVFLVHVAFARPALESFLFAVALAVGLTPELLPMIMTVTLSRGAIRLARDGVIVKRLAAIHDLGSMDVLCTDKTGTLTEARIALVRHIDPRGTDNDRVFRLAWLNSHFESGIRSPLDQAILDHGMPVDIEGFTKIDEVPFDFTRRRLSVLLGRGEDRLLVVKGAPEDVLALADRCDGADGGSIPLDEARRTAIIAVHDRFAAEGYRLLGLAWRAMPASAVSGRIEDEAGLVFAGFAVFLDPPKASAATAIRRLRELGVQVKVLSGDNELVVAHVARVVGLEAGEVLTGRDVANMDDVALAARAQMTTLFCRVDPAQKMRILRALQARQHCVGFLGDGINDAPALHNADVGISVEGAVDVAKHAADLVLTRPDISILAAGATEGRRTFANIRKYVQMGTSSNFGNMVSMALASLILPFLPMLPVQILLNNLIYDVSEIGIPFDAVDAEDTRKPQEWDMAALYRFTVIMGLTSSAFDLLTFWVLLNGFGADAATFRTAWFMESMATQILVIFIIRTRHLPWLSRPDRGLTATSLAALTVALLLPTTIPFGGWFQFTAIPPGIAVSMAAVVIGYLVAAFLARSFALRHPH